MTSNLDFLVPNGLLGGLLAVPTDLEMPDASGPCLDGAEIPKDASNLREKGEPMYTSSVGEREAEAGSELLVPNGLLFQGSLSSDTTSKSSDTPYPTLSSTIPSRRSPLAKDLDMDDGFGEPVLFNLPRQQDEMQLDSSPPTQSIPLSQSQSEYQDEEFPEIRDLLRPYAAATASTSRAATSTSSGTSRISLRATNYDGKTVLLKRKPRQFTSVLTSSRTDRAKMGTLLEVPIHRLMDDLSLNAATKLAHEDAQEVRGAPSTKSAETSLWVDRYSPRRFVDLVGDDRVNREVMSWVKEWDFCVFGKSKGKKRAWDEENTDEYRRPKEKLLLVSGPPGLGKTTLAHVIAKQAGYMVFEVNASDARSAQVVDDVIRPALESGKNIKNNKPHLIVIDEIDGATGGSDTSSGFIHRLIQLTLDKPTKKGRKGEREGPRPLLRPIICICNDLYHNSLTKLRQHARIIRVNRSNDLHIVNRLRDICEMEDLRADPSALSTLVGVAQGDLRGCLNTLQLIKARSETVTDTIVRRVTAGMKAGDVSQTSVLNDLFLPISRRRAKELGIGEEEEARYVGRLSQEISRNDALDKIAVGCFEHYTNLRKHDGNFERYLRANEWLSTFDYMSGEMRVEREYALREYLPFTLVPFYPLFQERSAPKVERPKADWENFTQTRVNEEIYKSLATCLRTASTRHGSEGAYRHFASAEILHTEFAPMINRIISPQLRPVNSQVIRPEERALLTRLVDIMVSLELRFIQEKLEDGQLVYRLEPPVDVFVTYDGKRASDIAVSRYATRHLVAFEIDARLANRQVEAMSMSKEKPKASARNFFGVSSKRTFDKVAEEDGGASGDGSLLAAVSGPALFKRVRLDKIEEKAPTDFFGRPIVLKKGQSKPVSSRKQKRPPVTYKFNEGNSAAVRKPVKVNAFI